MSVKEYITKSSQKTLRERREYSLFNDIQVYIKDSLPDSVDISVVIRNIENSIPASLVYGVEVIIIGKFEVLDARGVKAAFLDGGIYISNDQDNNDDIFDDIVHEISHSIEATHGSVLFSDGEMVEEYLGKKRRLIELLKSDGHFVPHDIENSTDYNVEFDEFLHYELGWEKAENYTSGLFINSYASVSLSEYFATGFESYYVDTNGSRLSKISPALHEKIEMLTDTNYSLED
tara:strand:- start:6370 stop:7068 length:699 start_codon:yes stop_codon:yes gene_type:complete